MTGVGSDRPSILFVGDSPQYADAKHGRVFQGIPGLVMQGILDRLGIPDEAAHFTLVFKCWLPENRKPSAKEMEQCMPLLEEEVKRLNPQYIIALGKGAASRLFPKTSLYRDRGTMMTSIYDIPGTITFHPGAILLPKGDTKLPFMISDVLRVWRMVKGSPVDPALCHPDTESFLVQSDEDMKQVLKRLKELPDGTMLSLDWETTGLIPFRDVPVCLGLSWKPGTGVAVEHWLVRKYAWHLRKELERFSLTGFNVAAFDYGFSEVLNLHKWFDHDAMMMHYALDERPQRRSQEVLSSQFLDAPTYESELLDKWETTKETFTKDVPIEDIMVYCAKDVDWALRLSIFFLEDLEERPSLMHMYRENLIKPAHVVGAIVRNGLWVDRERLNVVRNDLRQTLENLLKQMQNLTGKPDFNPNSPKQVATHLWDTLQLAEPSLFHRKERSADAETLNALKETYPDETFIQCLMDYRKNYVYFSRYVRDLEDMIDEHGRVHASIHLDRSETGRLSITKPPLHQIPREGIIRSIFAAPPKRKLIQADYAQLEIRVAAHVGNDRKLTSLLRSGVDFHTKMASEAFNVSVDEVTKDQRQAAKAVSFGLLYLMSEKKLANDTGLPPKEATAFVQRYKELMPQVQECIEETKALVRTQRYVDSVFDRRRRFHLLTDNNINGLEREAVNFRLGQSPGHDITMTAAVRLHLLFTKKYPEVRIVLTVHDSVIVECPDYLVDEIVAIMYQVMQTPPMETDVPFPVEIKVGQAWGEGEELPLEKILHRKPQLKNLVG